MKTANPLKEDSGESGVFTDPSWKSETVSLQDIEPQAESPKIVDVREDETRTLTRIDTILILITNAVGLGILSLPYALHTLGLVPGLIAIVGMGILTGYTAFVFLQFYRRYPHIVNIADIGTVVGGKPLEIAFGSLLVAMLCLLGGSCVVTLSIGLNFISGHAMCTIGFMGIAALVSWALCVPRSMKFCARMGYPATVSIITAVISRFSDTSAL
jgi:amino acid permease